MLPEPVPALIPTAAVPAAQEPRKPAARPAVRNGALVGAVAAAPALGSVLLSSLLAACAGCLGVGPAVVTGAAAGVGVSAGGVLVGLLCLLAVLAVQVVRLRRTCPVGPWRRRAVARQALTLVVVTAVSFAALQWVVAPALAPRATTSAPTLP